MEAGAREGKRKREGKKGGKMSNESERGRAAYVERRRVGEKSLTAVTKANRSART